MTHPYPHWKELERDDADLQLELEGSATRFWPGPLKTQVQYKGLFTIHQALDRLARRATHRTRRILRRQRDRRPY